MASKTGLASVADGEAGRLLKIDPRKLNIKPGWNSRNFDDPENIAHVDELARSIVAQGVKQPLTVSWSDDKVWIEDGECRWRATMRAIDVYKADIVAIPCRTEDKLVNDADKLVNQYIRNTGKPFSPMELSNHFKRLLGAGYEVKHIVEKTGLTAGRVSQILNLQTLPEPVKQMVTTGQVSASLAAKTVAEQGGSAAEKALKDGLAKAQWEGKGKVTAQHLPPSTPVPFTTQVIPTQVQPVAQAQPNKQLTTIVKEAFEYSDVDTDGDEDYVVISMPREHWAAIRDGLKL